MNLLYFAEIILDKSRLKKPFYRSSRKITISPAPASMWMTVFREETSKDRRSSR